LDGNDHGSIFVAFVSLVYLLMPRNSGACINEVFGSTYYVSLLGEYLGDFRITVKIFCLRAAYLEDDFVAETVQEHRQDAYAMVQYESACIERELWRERERELDVFLRRQEYEEHPYLFGGLWDAGDSPNVDALCFDHTDEDAGSADWCRICVAPRRDGVCYA